MFIRTRKTRKGKKVILPIAVLIGIVFIILIGWWLFRNSNSKLPPLPLPAAMTKETPKEDVVAKANELIKAGNAAEAKKLLLPWAEFKKNNGDFQPVLTLIHLLEKDELPKAIEIAKHAKDEFASSPKSPVAAIAYARLLEKKGDIAEANGIYTKIKESAPPELRAAALTGLGHDAERNKDLLAARDLYRQAVNEAAWNSEDWLEALDALGKVNISVIFSPAATPESKQYEVKKRDSITSIGNALNTTQGLLIRANSLNEATPLRLGQAIKYTPKDFHIYIERSTCRLFLTDKDGIFKLYKIGLGKPGHETALGSYKIGNKEKDPIWHKPGEGPIQPGDPRNELGVRWMPLVPDSEGLPKDLGIHGTIRPETIGTYSSNGCARLLNEEVEELYDLVVRSTSVDIVEQVTTAMIKAQESPGAPQKPAEKK